MQNQRTVTGESGMNHPDDATGTSGDGELVIEPRTGRRIVCCYRASGGSENLRAQSPDAEGQLIDDAPTHDSRSSRTCSAAAGGVDAQGDSYTPALTANGTHSSGNRCVSLFRHPDVQAALATNCLLFAVLFLECLAAFAAPRAAWLLFPVGLGGVAIWLGAPIVRSAAALLVSATLILLVLEWCSDTHIFPQPSELYLSF